MKGFLATTGQLAADSSSLNYAVGCLALAILGGLIVFGIIALVKAFIRRTTGWIVAGTISALFLAITTVVIIVASHAGGLGFLLVMLSGITILGGLIVFGIIALVKAFTRRTTGWIVAGTISALFFAITIVRIIAIGITAIMSAR